LLADSKIAKNVPPGVPIDNSVPPDVLELLKVVEPLAPLKKYYARELVQKIDKEPGQYLADGYLDWLLKALDFYRGDDERTMYVGITGVNIYSGDNN